MRNEADTLMELNANDIINHLKNRIADLELENAVLKAANNAQAKIITSMDDDEDESEAA